MADNDLQLQLSIETDASIAKAIADMEAISEEASDIEKGLAKVSRQKAFDDLARDAARLASETGDSAQATKLLVQELDRLGAKENEVERIVKQYQRLQAEIKQSASAQERFDATSKDVALAGDVQTNLTGGVAALTDFAFGGGGQQIAIVGEIIALGEELPRLKESLRGIPSAANAAGQALGLGGAGGLIGAMGLTAVAVAAVSVAFNHASKQINEAKNNLESQLDVQRQLAGEMSSLTTAGINERLEALRIEKQLQQDILDDLREGIEAQSAFGRGVANLFGLNKILKEQEEIVSTLGLEHDAYTSALDSSIVASNDATIVETELATAREEAGQQLIAQASFAGELVALQQQSAEFNEEELATKRLSLEQTKEQILAELALLEARSDGSEVVANQIANLKTEIGQLDESIAFLDSAQAKSAAAVNSAKEAEEELAKEREKTAKSTKSASEAESRRVLGDSAGGGRAIGGSGRSAIASTPLISNAENNDFLQAMNDAGENLREGIFAIRENLLHSIEDLRINRDRDVAKSIRSLDILGLRDIEENARYAAEDLNRNAKRDAISSERDYNRDMQMIAIDRQQQLKQIYEQGTQQIVNVINQKLSQIARGSIRNAPRTG